MNEIEKYVQEKLFELQDEKYRDFHAALMPSFFILSKNSSTYSIFELQDEKYRDFHAALMPTIDKETVIGVRSPHLKKLAKEFYKSGDYESYLKILPHKYYEENNVHAALIGFEKDYEKAIELLDEFLPFVDKGS